MRSVGGARPIARCAARAAAAMREIGGSPMAARAAAAQRVKVGHRAVVSLRICHAHTRRRTSAIGVATIAHNANAIAIAACP